MYVMLCAPLYGHSYLYACTHVHSTHITTADSHHQQSTSGLDLFTLKFNDPVKSIVSIPLSSCRDSRSHSQSLTLTLSFLSRTARSPAPPQWQRQPCVAGNPLRTTHQCHPATPNTHPNLPAPVSPSSAQKQLWRGWHASSPSSQTRDLQRATRISPRVAAVVLRQTAQHSSHAIALLESCSSAEVSIQAKGRADIQRLDPPFWNGMKRLSSSSIAQSTR